MNKYLLEIGTEELPYHFIPSAAKQLKSEFISFLDENKISYSDVKVYATPRRLAVIIDGLPVKQEDVEKVTKGPILSIACDANGNYTPAAIGFAKKNGISTNDLIKQDNYIWAKVCQKGKDTKEVIKAIVPVIISKFKGSHFMRWADLDVKFQRPVRWIVSLFNNEPVEVEFASVKSSNITRGHRFSDMNIVLNSPDDYIPALRKANVIADAEERKELIIKSATEKAKEIGAEVIFDKDLLEEVTYITEWPVPVVCSFDEKYLGIPEKVVVTVMAVHQRYFPLYKDGKLLNKFITMSNFVGDTFDNIRAGNERVVRARLEDAIFFVHEDTQKKLSDYIDDLKGVTFQKGYGSVYDKTQRIIELSKHLSSELQLPFADIERTALLCKADLVTKLVFEFTELQGEIGSAYAKFSGEKDSVVKGIKEHYYPLNADSELAESIEGQITGIADKIDTITVTFASGAKVSGSQDPLGVRRAAFGILKTVLQYNLKINLSELIKLAVKIAPAHEIDDNALYNNIKEFMEQRLLGLLSEKYKYDVLEACASNKDILADLSDFICRLDIVSEIISKQGYANFHEAINRIIRIIKNEAVSTDINEVLFNSESEKTLYEAVNNVNVSSDYSTLEQSLFTLIPHITKFFDDVLVMDKDEKVKTNRINLLNLVQQKFSAIADFSKIVF